METLEPIFILSAFFAGFLMFLAPCTLPLLPAYLGFISGVTEQEIAHPETRKQARKHVRNNSMMFLLGFSFVLILTGLSAGYIGSLISPAVRNTFAIFGGLLIMIFGLFMVGLIRPSFLSKERRMRVPKCISIGNPLSSLLLGSAFAIGWTPCIGPVYGTILIYASSTQTLLTGAFLLSIFALGFSIPFLTLAILISESTRFLEKAVPYLHIVSFMGGIVLLLLGLVLIIGNSVLTNWFFDYIGLFDIGETLMPYL
jgi:cytochrome c-type biogenesis protein